MYTHFCVHVCALVCIYIYISHPISFICLPLTSMGGRVLVPLWSVCVGFCLILHPGLASGALRTNYYANVCPNVESIVREVVKTKINQTFVTIPATLRLFFHDCIVQVTLPDSWHVCTVYNTHANNTHTHRPARSIRKMLYSYCLPRYHVELVWNVMLNNQYTNVKVPCVAHI